MLEVKILKPWLALAHPFATFSKLQLGAPSSLLHWDRFLPWQVYWPMIFCPQIGKRWGIQWYVYLFIYLSLTQKYNKCQWNNWNDFKKTNPTNQTDNFSVHWKHVKIVICGAQNILLNSVFSQIQIFNQSNKQWSQPLPSQQGKKFPCIFLVLQKHLFSAAWLLREGLPNAERHKTGSTGRTTLSIGVSSPETIVKKLSASSLTGQTSLWFLLLFLDFLKHYQVYKADIKVNRCIQHKEPTELTALFNQRLIFLSFTYTLKIISLLEF